MTLRIRGHTLLCIQGFVGEGYSPEFVANMRAIVDRLDARAEVTVVTEPDAICAACPHLTKEGCALHGPGTERGIVAQDRGVLARLGLEEGETAAWGEILSRIRRSVAPGDLDSICGTCPWLPLGHCRAGLSRGRS